jgi:hypothetical protein
MAPLWFLELGSPSDLALPRFLDVKSDVNSNVHFIASRWLTEEEGSQQGLRVRGLLYTWCENQENRVRYIVLV